MTSVNTPMTRTISVSALTLTMGLALTACGSAKNVYDFTQINGMEPTSDITVQIPEDLKRAAGADAEGLLVTSYAAKAHKLDGRATARSTSTSATPRVRPRG